MSLDVRKRVKIIQNYDMTWNWDSSNPTFQNKTPNSDWGRHIKFDPFPCYSHDEDLVRKTVELVELKFPISFDVYYFVYPYESLERTNGTASKNTITWGDEEKGEKSVWEGTIDLYGKRIPIHPAMTFYLCGHEYGHVIDDWICNRRGLKDNGLDEEYAKMRNIDYNNKYGGQKWHTNIGEIIANDFRIVVTGLEKEFWPHECKHPDEDPNVKAWWEEAVAKYSIKK